MSIEKSRDLSIDAARGVALFFVALSHAHHNPHYVTAFYIMAFFFLSGWLYKPGKSYEENIKKKAQRVLLPYFSNSVILLVIYSLMKHFSSQEIERTINGIMYSRNAIVIGVDEPIMGSIANNPLWYLTAFFATSLLFHLIVNKCTSDRRIFLLSNLILITISILLSQLPILLPWSLDMISFFASVMLIGYWFKFNNVNLDLSWTTTIFLILGYVVICYENGPINLSVRNLGGGYVNSLVVGICGTLGCVSLCKKTLFKPYCKCFAKIGRNSIVTLSFHLMLIGIFRHLLRLLNIGKYWENTYLYDFFIVIIAMISCVTIGEIIGIIKKQFIFERKSLINEE